MTYSGGEGGLGKINLVGRTIAGRYELRGVLGRGGMATVYRAYQAGLDREVAVKVIAANLAHDPEFIERFRREARTVARLRHPHILTVHDFGEEQGLLYLVTELIVGGSLAEHLAEPRRPERALDIVAQIGAALDYAHAQGIVHRDVKPQNVFIDRQRGDQAILADFGIAKATLETTGAGLTGTGLSIGTPEYMAPEQLLGRPVDGRADLYALAVIAYQLLAGRLPFARGGPHDTPIALAMRKVQTAPPAPSTFNPNLSPAIDQVLARALATDPGDRFATAGELAAALHQALGPGQPHPPLGHGATTIAGPAPSWAIPTTPVPTSPPAAYDVHTPGSLPRLQTPPSQPAMPLASAPAAPPPTGPARRTWVPVAGGVGATLLVCLLALALWRALAARGAGGGVATLTPPPGTAIAAGAPIAPTPTIGLAATPTTAATPSPTTSPTQTPTATATPAPTEPPTPTAITGLGGGTTPPRPTATLALEAVVPPTATPVPPTPTLVPTPTPIPPPTPTATPIPPPTPTPLPARTTGAPGGLILYSSDKEGHWAIYRLSPDGSGERRLTDLSADNYYGVWSPDGRQIAFISERDRNPEVYLMNADGGGQRRLTTDAGQHAAPAWAPDSRRLAYVLASGGTNAVYYVDIATNRRTGLINSPAGWPAWSRNDDIAWTRVDGGYETIFLSTVTGSTVRKVPRPDQNDDTPSYSPDGNALALTSGPKDDRQIVVCAADGSGRRAITGRGADNSNPVWSPDGAWIAYSSTASGSQQLIVMRSDGSGARTITGGQGKKWYLSWR